jgi:hypothetical protein
VTAAPTLAVSCPDPVIVPACSSQATIDGLFADWIAEFEFTGGCNVTATNLSGFTAPDDCASSITYIATDECGQSQQCSSTFTVTAAPTLAVSCPDPVIVPACSSQATIDGLFADWIAEFEFTGGCNVTATNLSGFTAPDDCAGGVVSITYIATDDCGQSQQCSSTFIVTAAPTLAVSCPDPVIVPACSSQATIDGLFAGWIAEFEFTGGCNATATNLSGFTAPDDCAGGMVSITYIAIDDCGQSQQCSSTFTVTAAPTLAVSCPEPGDRAGLQLTGHHRRTVCRLDR